MDFLSDSDLSMLTDDEIEEYWKSLLNEGARIKAAFIKPTSKWWSRIEAYRDGKNGDELFPKRREFYTYVKKGKLKTVRSTPKSK